MYAVLFIPTLPLQALLRTEPGLAGKPVALLADANRKAAIRHLTPEASAAGVEPGMTASQGLARCARLLLRHPCPPAEKAANHALLSAAFSLSPRVEETRIGVCTVDLQGCFRPRLSKQTRQITERLSRLGLNTRIGIGPTPLIADFASQRAHPVLDVGDGIDFIANLPVGMAGPTPEQERIFTGWGIHTLGALRSLSREAVGRRLGHEGLVLWDRAAGRETRVLQHVSLPATFAESVEFECPLETLEPLLFILRRLVDQLCLQLEVAGKAAERLHLTLSLRDRSTLAPVLRVPEPTVRSEVLFRMLHTHLENVRTDHPITGVALRVAPASPSSRQQDLFATDLHDPHRFAETLARLSALVGPDRSGSPRNEATRRPDAFRMVPMKTVPPAPPAAYAPPVCGPILRRFRPPFPVTVKTTADRPLSIVSETVSGTVLNWRGPWRRSGDWWDTTRWNREEWDIQLEHGGLYRLVRERRSWWLEGVYD